MVIIYKNAIGINMTIYTAFDITGYSSVVLYIKKPDGTLLTKTPTVVSEPTGELSYVTLTGDLDQAGDYTAQAVVNFTDGDVAKGELDGFVIYTPIV